MANPTIGVSAFIAQLRSDLEAAIHEGTGKSLRFGVESLEVELQVVATMEGTAGATTGGGLRLGIFSGNASAEAKASYLKSQVQTVRLKLRPERRTDDGGGDDLDEGDVLLSGTPDDG